MLTIREGTSLDLPLLEEMLFEAFFWASAVARPPMVEFRRRLEFSTLLAAWGRPGDLALIAQEGGDAAGAVWFRLWTSDLHSYGFVDEATPELGLAVVRRFRGRGIARSLLRAAIQSATQCVYPALSLSVAPDNPARRLYESEGFVKVGETGTSWTMRRELLRS
jgi:ribosomal protein S18 acetylase RimI-like enzyme